MSYLAYLDVRVGAADAVDAVDAAVTSGSPLLRSHITAGLLIIPRIPRFTWASSIVMALGRALHPPRQCFKFISLLSLHVLQPEFPELCKKSHSLIIHAVWGPSITRNDSRYGFPKVLRLILPFSILYVSPELVLCKVNWARKVESKLMPISISIYISDTVIPVTIFTTYPSTFISDSRNGRISSSQVSPTKLIGSHLTRPSFKRNTLLRLVLSFAVCSS